MERMPSLLAIVILLLSPLLSAPKSKTHAADNRQKVWSLRFDQFLKDPPGWTGVDRHETQGLAFSPDGRRLAVTLTHHQRVSDNKFLWNTHLLIISVSSPENNIRQYDLTEVCGVDLTWNVRGDAILVCGAVLQVATGASCAVIPPPPKYPSLTRAYSSYRSFWLDSDRIIVWNGTVLNLSCTKIDSLALRPNWRIIATAPTKGLVLQWHSPPHWRREPNLHHVCQYEITNLDSSLALSAWELPFPCESPKIITAASAYCVPVRKHSADNEKLQCKSILANADIPVPKEVRDYRVLGVAAESPRLIAEKWEYRRDAWWQWLLFSWWIPDPGSPALPRHRAVFDLGSETLVSSWTPRIQVSDSPYVDDRPYRCAISGDGEFVVESGDGVLDVFRLNR